MPRLKIAILIGTTRDARFGHVPAQWMYEHATRRQELDVQVVDLKDFKLPFFNERMSDARVPFEDPNAVAWQKTIREFDGYIVVTPEYNRSITGALKNAFEQAHMEWSRKPIGFLGYGAVGAARAIEHARNIAVELDMVPVRSAIHIGGSEFLSVVRDGNPICRIEKAIVKSANAMLDQLTWWAWATKNARSRGENE